MWDSLVAGLVSLVPGLVGHSAESLVTGRGPNLESDVAGREPVAEEVKLLLTDLSVRSGDWLHSLEQLDVPPLMLRDSTSGPSSSAQARKGYRSKRERSSLFCTPGGQALK